MKTSFADNVEETIFRLSELLELPVIVLALAALAWVIVETGAFAVESWQHRKRSLPKLTSSAQSALKQLAENDAAGANAAVQQVAWTPAMSNALGAFVSTLATGGSETLIAKHLADFDFGRQRRLGRTRLLVRAGPALGLMGTLIPLSPALEGLANGEIDALTENLRVAFSITVLGLLIGAISFGLSLARDRLYGQDYSDLEYVAAILTGEDEVVVR